jgi:magnesium transporter
MAHALFGPEVRFMLADGNDAGLKAFVESIHPSTIVETLAGDNFSIEEVWRVLSQAAPREQASVFEYFPIELQVKMAEGAGRPQMARLIELMSHDDRAELLRRLSPQVREALLRLVDEADRRDIANLVQYPEHTVGGIMTTDYAWLPGKLTAAQAIERLRQQAPDRETIYYIYVLHEASRRLEGILTLRTLVLAAPGSMVSDIMEANEIIGLSPTDDVNKAGPLFARYDLLAIPVLDGGRLVGIVTHDDVIDVITEEATEDLQRQAGVGPIRESYFDAPFLKMWYSRGGWLALLFVLQMLTINVMEHYEGEMKAMIVLTFFTPVCLSVGGNAGSQAATLVTRALALDQIQLKDWFRVARREILIGIALGVVIGILGLVRTWLLTPENKLEGAGRAELSYVIAIAVTFICIWGTLIGSLLPLVFRRLGFDPAIASSPFIATLSDVCGIIIYFNCAYFIMLKG